jgi:Polyketide cyclase / dehydrase and lipid transport
VASNDYHFVTTWHVPATPEEITSVLGDAAALSRWWPSVYLNVREVQPGDAAGVGKVVSLWTKGWLPYTLRWQFTVTESDPPHGFRLEAEGDFVGVGIWSLFPERTADAPDGPMTAVTYDWTVIAEKGVLKRLSIVMRSIFAANHHWAMARGEESLRLELARRHAVSDPTVAAAIPSPPGPTFPHNMLVRHR